MTEYSVEKFYNEYAIKQEDTIVAVIDSGTNARKVCDLLNEQDKTIKELKQDNDIKFWKLQCMHYFNANSLFMSEISRAIKKGYKVSDKFQEYLDELEENTKKIKEKNKRLFGDVE